MRSFTAARMILRLWFVLVVLRVSVSGGDVGGQSGNPMVLPAGERCCLKSAGDTPIAKSKRKPKSMAFILGAQKSGRPPPSIILRGSLAKLILNLKLGVTHHGHSNVAVSKQLVLWHMHMGACMQWGCNDMARQVDHYGTLF